MPERFRPARRPGMAAFPPDLQPTSLYLAAGAEEDQRQSAPAGALQPALDNWRWHCESTSSQTLSLPSASWFSAATRKAQFRFGPVTCDTKLERLWRAFKRKPI